VLLPAPHLSPVAPICSYVDDKNVPSVIYGLLTLAVAGLGSGGDSDSRAKANSLCQMANRDIEQARVVGRRSREESLGCAQLGRIEERRCVSCSRFILSSLSSLDTPQPFSIASLHSRSRVTALHASEPFLSILWSSWLVAMSRCGSQHSTREI